MVSDKKRTSLFLSLEISSKTNDVRLEFSKNLPDFVQFWKVNSNTALCKSFKVG
ncbi:unnamed protein product [Rodentolepis nana]|uniref:Uncharacterized protein n=1 Tax=Rodentolepis nana TaxID=102285 RepID=A0A0R3TCY5_RODNA|nr:unnamed protein product [Rodentolepis nana]